VVKLKSQPRTKILVGCDAALFAWQVFTDLLKTAVLVMEFFKLLGATYKVPGGVLGWV